MPFTTPNKSVEPRGVRKGPRGKCQLETWIVTAAAKQLFGLGRFSGSPPRSSTHVLALHLPAEGLPKQGGAFRVSWSGRKQLVAHPCIALLGPHTHGRWWPVMGVHLLSRQVRCCRTVTKAYRIKKKNKKWNLTCRYIWR